MIKQQRKFYKLKGPRNNSKINGELAHFQYALVEARRKNVLAHAARFYRVGTRIKYASSFLRFRISLGSNSEPSKPHKNSSEDVSSRNDPQTISVCLYMCVS
jgi:hypothetical protein